jgi:hypothetical protein
MGYVTAQQLIEKYGSGENAARAYLENDAMDEDEREACRYRLNATSFALASHRILMEKLLSLEKILRREEG